MSPAQACVQRSVTGAVWAGALLCASSLLGVGCEARLVLGSPCTFNSECQAGLVCGIGGRCRVACLESRDCTGGARCIRDPDTDLPACSLPVDACMAMTCARGLVCLEGACVNECATPDECPDRRCVSGACVPILAGVDASVPVDAGALDAITSFDAPDAPSVDAPDAPLTDVPDSPVADAPLGPPIRLVAPLSTSRVSDRRPTVRWALRPGIDGARLSFYGERACTTLLADDDIVGASGEPGAALGPGVVFFLVEGMTGGVVVTRPSAVWEIEIPATDGVVDTALSRFPDFDGDGRGDLAVSTAIPAGFDRGEVLVWWGATSPEGREPDVVYSTATMNVVRFGQSVSAGGDVNGDGFGDLVIGAAGTSGAPHVGLYVYHGGPAGLDPMPALTLIGDESYAFAVVGVGDVDGDGYGDVAVGNTTGRREVIVLAGSDTGLTSSAIRVLSSHAGDVSFGAPIAATDFDGDGRSDVAVGAYSNGFADGRVYVYSGPALAERRIVEPNPASRQHWAQALAALDANGDGYGDLAVSEHLSQRVYVLRGSATGLVETSTPWISSALANYGMPLSAAGDLDGDGDEELLVGWNGERPNVVATVGLSAPGDYSVALPAGCPTTCGFGGALGALGDRDGDGLDDIVIAGTAAMQVHLFHGVAIEGGLRRPIAVVRTELGFGRAVTSR